MNITTALNKKYVPYTIVMLTSLCVNNQIPVQAYILHSELDDADFDTMRGALSAYDITLIPLFVDRTLFEDKLPHNEQWSMETYYRLLLLDLLPDIVERILYLDVDVIVNGSVTELFNRDFEGNEILAALNANGNIPHEEYGRKHIEMFAPMNEQGYQYFNAGVMLMNIAEMRKHYSFASYLDAIREWDFAMEAPDQDILNYVHWKKVGYIDYAQYDMFSRTAHNKGLHYDDLKDSCAIVHYAGDKPWESTNVHYDIEQLWWDYAKLTPIYHELLEGFLHSTLTNTVVEDFIIGLQNDNTALKDALLQLNNRVKELFLSENHPV